MWSLHGQPLQPDTQPPPQVTSILQHLPGHNHTKPDSPALPEQVQKTPDVRTSIRVVGTIRAAQADYSQMQSLAWEALQDLWLHPVCRGSLSLQHPPVFWRHQGL